MPRSTLVPALQRTAEDAVRATGRAAAVLVVDPNTGHVLARASVGGERGDPLLSANVPASTFKVFASIAGLESGAFTATTTEECTGHFTFAGRDLVCPAAHGKETVHDAIVRSCNGFYYAAGVKHRALVETARAFGFGEPSGMAPDEAKSTLESDERLAEIERDETSAVPLLDAIGHGEITVTLPELARAFSAVANGGTLFRLSTTDAPGPPPTRPSVRAETLEVAQAAMLDVVRAPDGTAHSVFSPDLSFAGKTGNVDAPPANGKDDDRDLFFIAYAPPERPEILVAARVERVASPEDAKRAVKSVLSAWRETRSR